MFTEREADVLLFMTKDGNKMEINRIKHGCTMLHFKDLALRKKYFIISNNKTLAWLVLIVSTIIHIQE